MIAADDGIARAGNNAAMRLIVLLALMPARAWAVRYEEVWPVAEAPDWIGSQVALVVLCAWVAWRVWRDPRARWPECVAWSALAVFYPVAGVLVFCAVLAVALIGASL